MKPLTPHLAYTLEQIINLFRKRNPARELAHIGIEKRRRSVNEVARQIRRELGLPEDRRLA